MADRPTLHLTNFASRKLHTGRVLSIMARPRWFERAAALGTVELLAPDPDDLVAVQAEEITPAEYRRRFEDRLRFAEGALGPLLAPGELVYTPRSGPTSPFPAVPDGATLCCACSRDAALAGRCHRAWAAPFLHRAGWAVVLDGFEFLPSEAPRG